MSPPAYHVRWRGKVTGPFEVDQLRHLIRQGELSKLHDVSTDQVTWHQAGQLQDLFPSYVQPEAPSPEVYDTESDWTVVSDES